VYHLGVILLVNFRLQCRMLRLGTSRGGKFLTLCFVSHRLISKTIIMTYISYTSTAMIWCCTSLRGVGLLL
jgi:hypothetical protein